MKFQLTFAVIAVIIRSSGAETCDACASTYTTEKGAATDEPGKCIAAKKFGNCLISASGTGCDSGDNVPATQFGSGALKTDMGGYASCTFDALCSTCQLNYQTALLARTTSTTSKKKCAEAFTYTECIESKPSTELACDATTTKATMDTNSLTTAKADCVYSKAIGLKSSAIIVAISLFISYMKF